jgi:DNA-binding NtrC family response regulator
MSRTVRCLMVEDSPEDAVLIKRELEKGGYNPFWERVDTPEALADALRVSQWDVMIVDYSMPRFDALAALEIVKSGGYDIPFIIVSGTVGEEVAVAAMRQGAHDYIPKANLRRLVAAVERELNEYAKRKDAKKLERSLRDTQKEAARLSDLLEMTDQPFGTGFVDGRFGVCNAAFERLLGYTRAELRSMGWVDTFTPEKWRSVQAQKLDELNRTGVPVRFEK